MSLEMHYKEYVKSNGSDDTWRFVVLEQHTVDIKLMVAWKTLDEGKKEVRLKVMRGQSSSRVRPNSTRFSGDIFAKSEFRDAKNLSMKDINWLGKEWKKLSKQLFPTLNQIFNGLIAESIK